MNFKEIAESLLVGLFLVMFIHSPTSELRDAPIISEEYHNLYYIIFILLFAFWTGVFWIKNDFEIAIGQTISLIIWIWVLYKKYVYLYSSNHEDEKVNDDTSVYKNCNFIRYSIIFWIIVWIGTLIDWEDYSYFILVRFVVCIICICSMEIAYSFSKLFSLCFLILTLLFNPIIPLTLTKDIWHFLDSIVLVILCLFYFKLKRVESL